MPQRLHPKVLFLALLFSPSPALSTTRLLSGSKQARGEMEWRGGSRGHLGQSVNYFIIKTASFQWSGMKLTRPDDSNPRPSCVAQEIDKKQHITLTSSSQRKGKWKGDVFISCHGMYLLCVAFILYYTNASLSLLFVTMTPMLVWGPNCE